MLNYLKNLLDRKEKSPIERIRQEATQIQGEGMLDVFTEDVVEELKESGRKLALAEIQKIINPEVKVENKSSLSKGRKITL